MPSVPSDPLSVALDEAIAGREGRLFDLLARGSRLPGPRANDALAEAFVQACRARGPSVDRLALRMCRLSADEAPGATALEFLPVCGVLALGARSAADVTARDPGLAELHACADDLRFRVRDAVVDALSQVGGAAGDSLVASVASWMDGYFHAAAVLRAMSREPWMSALHAGDGVVARLDEALVLVRDAPRSAVRYPGHKSLVDALAHAPAVLALRFGVPVFDLLVRWTSSSDPALRALLGASVRDKKLAGRFGPELARLRVALEASQAAPRNPDHDFGPSRDRGGTRARKRYR
jgi:hypothetical protein